MFNKGDKVKLISPTEEFKTSDLFQIKEFYIEPSMKVDEVRGDGNTYSFYENEVVQIEEINTKKIITVPLSDIQKA